MAFNMEFPLRQACQTARLCTYPVMKQHDLLLKAHHYLTAFKLDWTTLDKMQIYLGETVRNLFINEMVMVWKVRHHDSGGPRLLKNVLKHSTCTLVIKQT